MPNFNAARTVPSRPVGPSILGWSLIAGMGLGVAAKLLGQFQGPLAFLGVQVAVWVTAGFLIARVAANGRGRLDGTVWAGTTMAVYLSGWLLSYCVIFGLQQSAGFGAAWLDERIFFIAAPAVSAILGFLAMASLRRGWFGSACLAAPIAWSLPELSYALLQGWNYVALVAAPMVLLAAVPLVRSRRQANWAVVAAACAAGGVVAFVFLRMIDGRM